MPSLRYGLPDFEWTIIAPQPLSTRLSVARVDDPRVLNGICWRLRTRSRWADIAERHGLAATCYYRFIHWRKLGSDIRCGLQGLWRRSADGLFFVDPGPSVRHEQKRGLETGAANLKRA